MSDERTPAWAEALRADLASRLDNARADIMARLDRLQGALTQSQDESR